MTTVNMNQINTKNKKQMKIMKSIRTTRRLLCELITRCKNGAFVTWLVQLLEMVSKAAQLPRILA